MQDLKEQEDNSQSEPTLEPKLEEIYDAWPDMPENVRAVIVNFLKANKSREKN